MPEFPSADSIGRGALAARLQAFEARAARLHTLARVNRVVSSSLDTEQVLGEIAAAVVRLIDVPVASFWIADDATRTLELAAYSDEVPGAQAPVLRLAFGEGAIGWVA